MHSDDGILLRDAYSEIIGTVTSLGMGNCRQPTTLLTRIRTAIGWLLVRRVDPFKHLSFSFPVRLWPP